MQKISNELIHKVKSGDLNAMVSLDKMGLFPAIDEDAEAFSRRIALLKQNLTNLEQQLAEKGQHTVEDVTVHRKKRIPQELYSQAYKKTEELYGFRCEWVPGFFINPNFSALFGGCAYYFYPDFYALFIIRESFRKKQKWLIYNRDELLAHELCHVARVGLFSEKYEEYFAYQTASSNFRRLMGGVFQSQMDVFIFMGTTLLLLVMQIVRTLMANPFAAIISWIPFILCVLWLGIKLARTVHLVKLAEKKLTSYCRGNEKKARIALFHCSDDDVLKVAGSCDIDSTLKHLAEENLRWKIVLERFKTEIAAN